MALFHADSTYWYRAGRRGKFERNFPSTFGEYELLADIEVTSATTSVDITGLSLDSDDEILLVADVHNGVSNSGGIHYLCANGNTTLSNYWYQQIYTLGTSIAAVSGSTPHYLYVESLVDGSERSLAHVNINLTADGYFTFQSDLVRAYDTGSRIGFTNYRGTSTFTASNITEINLRCDDTNGIGIGSRFWLYKRGDAS